LKVIQADPLNPRQDHIVLASRIIKAGGVIVFPTQHLYGLGADAMNAKAVDRVFQIKRRPYHKPLLVLISDQDELTRLVQHISPAAERIMACWWPGAVTLIFRGKATLPANLMAGTGKIGVRMPQHPVALALSKVLGGPFTATSANISGGLGCSTISDLDTRIADHVDLILDVGTLKGGTGSTVVDVTADSPIILREGAIPTKNIMDVLEKQKYRML